MKLKKKLSEWENGKGRTVLEFVKFNLVSVSVTAVQLLLANVFPLIFDAVRAELPPLLQTVFRADVLFPEGGKYVVNGAVTYGYVLPFLLSNLLANIYGYFVNMKATFKGKGKRYSFPVYIAVLLALILFSTWLQGVIVAGMRFSPLSRTVAAMVAGMVQLCVLFPLEKYILFTGKETK